MQTPEKQWQSRIANNDVPVYNSNIYIFCLFSFYATAILKSLHHFCFCLSFTPPSERAFNCRVPLWLLVNERQSEGKNHPGSKKKIPLCYDSRSFDTRTLCSLSWKNFMGMWWVWVRNHLKKILRQFIKDFHWANHFN